MNKLNRWFTKKTTSTFKQVWGTIIFSCLGFHRYWFKFIKIGDNLKVFMNIEIGFEMMIVFAILLGKSLAGYLLLIYYGVEAIF